MLIKLPTPDIDITGSVMKTRSFCEGTALALDKGMFTSGAAFNILRPAPLAEENVKGEWRDYSPWRNARKLRH